MGRGRGEVSLESTPVRTRVNFDMETETISTTEARKRLGCTSQTIRNLIKGGKLEAVQLENGIIGDQEMANLIRTFKKKITNFRRTKAFQEKVIGGVDYIEQTYNIEDKGISVNTHSHHVWLGKFWKQDEFQKDWGHGVVRIEDCTSVRSVMKYISKYITKDDVNGSRCKETFGIIREK